jgi:Domain of unknown function (DUF4263)
VRTIQIATEDRFIVVKFAAEFTEESGAFRESPAILRDLLMYGFSDQYTLLCDCRSLQNVNQEIADGILKLCKAGIPAICLEPYKDRLEAYGRKNNLHGFRILSVRHGQSPLQYIPVASALFESPVEHYVDMEGYFDYPNPRFQKAASKFNGVRSSEEFDFASNFVQAHYEIESIARDYYNLERALLEEATEQPTQEASKRDFEYGPEGDEDSDFEHHRDYIEDIYTVSAVASLRALRSAVRDHALNSLFVEYAVQLRGNEMLLTPYHSHAVHSIETKNELVLGRPGVVAEKTASLLAPQISEFESLLANKRVREFEIQTYLERSPTLLQALGYAQVYPQVVLQRDDGTFLRPDFIVQPTSDEWCDIVDIKLPTMQTVVGVRDRKTLSSAIHELAAQLREYSAYFENENLSRRLEQRYGIKCYRPRLIGVIGTDPRLADDRQMRRLMTAYSDVRILTFDQLLLHAKNRLLI